MDLNKLEVKGRWRGDEVVVRLTCEGAPLVESMEEDTLCCSECGAKYQIEEAMDYVKAFGLAMIELYCSLASNS